MSITVVEISINRDKWVCLRGPEDQMPNTLKQSRKILNKQQITKVLSVVLKFL